jgi:hypothetical protein
VARQIDLICAPRLMSTEERLAAQNGGCAHHLNRGLITVRDRVVGNQSRGNAVDCWLFAGLAADLGC